MAKDKVKERVNWPVTILLIIGLFNADQYHEAFLNGRLAYPVDGN